MDDFVLEIENKKNKTKKIMVVSHQEDNLTTIKKQLIF